MINKDILNFRDTKILLIIISLFCPIFGAAVGILILLDKEKKYENVGELMLELSIIEALIIIIPGVSNPYAAKFIVKILPVMIALFIIFGVVLFYRMVTFKDYSKQLSDYYEKEKLPEETSKFKFYGIYPEINYKDTDFYIWKCDNYIILLDSNENGFGRIEVPIESISELSLLLKKGKEYAIISIDCEDGVKEIAFEKQLFSIIREMI